MRLYNIIKKPVVTEKSANLELNSTYVVEVSADATKIDIKKAFLYIYGIELSDVRIVNTREKFKNWRKWIVFRKRTAKKAYITLKDKNTKVDFSILK